MPDNRRCIVTDEDLRGLARLLEHPRAAASTAHALLKAKLTQAVVVPAREAPPTVATMNSRVLFEDEDTGIQLELQLVYPQDAAWQSERLSILTPLGVALLGLSVGETAEFQLSRARRRLRLLEVVAQPGETPPELPPAA